MRDRRGGGPAGSPPVPVRAVGSRAESGPEWCHGHDCSSLNISRSLLVDQTSEAIGVELESLVKGGLISKLIFVQVDPGQILNTLHWDRNKICQFLA